MSVVDSYTLRLPGTPEAGGKAAEAVQKWVAEWDIPENLGELILLAVAEAVSNAAEHGNRLHADKEIILIADKSNQHITISVEDQGEGLSGERLNNAQLPSDPFDIRGRGLYIIKEVATRVWLEAEGRRLCMAWEIVV